MFPATLNGESSAQNDRSALCDDGLILTQCNIYDIIEILRISGRRFLRALEGLGIGTVETIAANSR
jgi:hypothetical protein